VPPRAAEALAILERHGAIAAGVGPTLVRMLERERSDAVASAPGSPADAWTNAHGCRVEHVLLGSNTTAVEAAAARARTLGYDVVARAADPDGVESADAVGRRLAREGRELMAAARRDGRPRAVVEGGEAVVCVPADHGRGGRNQQTVVAALADMRRGGDGWPAGLVVASIGSDGEDGPTTAAGGCVDAQVAARALGLDVDRALARCDAHPLLDAIGGLVVTGPTGTNVADLRVVLARPGRSGSPSC
jgi:hydroxypyruvate reductase